MSDMTTPEIYYAWFSKKQKEISGEKRYYNNNQRKQTKSNIYLSLDGREVEVTEVSTEMTNHSERFSDSQYLGKVSKWIRSIY
jgi:hypothetical protein